MPSGNYRLVEMAVPCGKCEACLLNRQMMWRIRLNEEFKASKGAIFFTLTYRTESLPFQRYFDEREIKSPIMSRYEINKFGPRLNGYVIRDRLNQKYHRVPLRIFDDLDMIDRVISYNEDDCTVILDHPKFGVSKWYSVVYKKDLQDFMKRLRKSFEPFKIRFFASSEYTPEHTRPHFHGIIFDYPYDKNLPREKVLKEVHDRIEATWKNGFVTTDFCNGPRCNYCAKYCVKPSDALSIQRPAPFILCSRRPAIGSAYLERLDRIAWHIEQHNTTYVADNFKKHGKPFKTKLPKYYVDKIFFDPDYRAEQSLYERVQRLFGESYPFDHLYDLRDSEYVAREEELEAERQRADEEAERRRPGSVREKLAAKKAQVHRIVTRTNKGGPGTNRMK